MNIEQVVQEIQREIAVIKTKQNNDHTRIEENKTLGTEIHKLSANLMHLTEQLKGQNERMDKLINTYDTRFISYDTRFNNQGERLGAVESHLNVQKVMIDKVLKRLDDVESYVDYIRTKGSRRWDGIVEKVGLVIVGAVIMFILYQFGL